MFLTVVEVFGFGWGDAAGVVVFTSGVTEANNLALQGTVAAMTGGSARLMVSAVEHASVSRTAQWLADRGLAKLEIVGVTAAGWVRPDIVAELIGPDVVMMSVMAANSETGVLNPVGEIAEHPHPSLPALRLGF